MGWALHPSLVPKMYPCPQAVYVFLLLHLQSRSSVNTQQDRVVSAAAIQVSSHTERGKRWKLSKKFEALSGR